MKNIHKINGQIYITNDEEIKVGDWVLFESHNVIRKAVDSTFAYGVNNIRIYADKKVFKIILTTDPELQKDNVQSIPDDFLEWFVKNPSCERVELEVDLSKHNGQFQTKYGYKIIIPKQQTHEI